MRQAVQLEDLLDHRDLVSGGLEATEGRPVVDEQAGADHVTAPIDRAGHEGHLEQRGQLVLLLDGGLRVHNASLVVKRRVAAHQDIVGNGVAEYLDLEHVGYDLLGLLVQVGVDERDVVVARDHVAQRGQTLLDALYAHRVGQAVPDMLELLIGCGARHEQAVAVADDEAANDTALANRCVHNGYVIG